MSIETKDRPDLDQLGRLIPNKVEEPECAMPLVMDIMARLMQLTHTERHFLFKTIADVESTPPCSEWLEPGTFTRQTPDEVESSTMEVFIMAGTLDRADLTDRGNTIYDVEYALSGRERHEFFSGLSKLLEPIRHRELADEAAVKPTPGEAVTA